MRNTLRFFAIYARNLLIDHLRKIKYSPETLEGKVLRRGYAMIPSFMSLQEVDDLLEEIKRLDFSESPQKTKTLVNINPEEGKKLQEFRNMKILAELSNNIIGRDATELFFIAYKKAFHGKNCAFDQFVHSDSWNHRLKFWLFLTDFTSENGAPVFYPGTATPVWKWRFDYRHSRGIPPSKKRYITNDKELYVGTLSDEQELPSDVRKLQEVIIGSRGTLLVWDARIFHRAMPLSSGERLHLESYWVQRGLHT